jgi:hypothetical protein
MDIKQALRREFKDGNMQMFHIEGDIWLVPCVTNYSENEFRPLLKPLANHSEKPAAASKQGWTTSEDEILLKIVSSRGAKAWSSIAKEINALVHNGSDVRLGRHCRERWFNHVDPELKKGEWTEGEDQHLITLQKELGNKWSEISRKMPGRTENSVKNRFKSLEKKKTIVEENKGFLNLFSQDIEIKPMEYGFNTMLLMSPQIINFDIITSPQPEKLRVPDFIRPITNKIPKMERVSETKERLRNDLFGYALSPSEFLNIRNA